MGRELKAMSNRNFYMRSLKIKNLRGFRDLNIPKLRQVNFIGGLNSSGKSSLLECIFVFFDRKNVGSFSRLIQFRNLPFDFFQQIHELFYQFNDRIEASIEAESIHGKEKLSFKYTERLPLLQNLNVPAEIIPQQTLQISGQKGLIISGQVDSLKDEMYATGQGNQINGHVVSSNTPRPPRCFIFTALTRNNHAENIKFFSSAIQNGHKDKLLECLRLLRSEIKNIELLQIAGQPVIYVDIGLQRLLPLADLGDGIYFALIIASCLVSNEDSILLLDEFDACIHYSKLESIWNLISKLASQFHVQIFATSHSIESISAAALGFEKNQRLNDFSYIRLDRTDDGVTAEIYEPKEIRQAIEREWEVR